MLLFLDQVTHRNEGSDRPIFDGVSLFVRSGEVIVVVAQPPSVAAGLLAFIGSRDSRDGVLIGSDGSEDAGGGTDKGGPTAVRAWRASDPCDSFPPRWGTEVWRGVTIRRYACPNGMIDGSDRQPDGTLVVAGSERPASNHASVPDLLLIDDLADNPAFPDADARRAFLRDLRSLHPAPERRTMCYATRDTDDALAVADRIALLQQGRLVQFATPAEVYNTPATEFVAQCFGQPVINLVPAILEKDGQALLIGNQTVSLAGQIAETFCRDVTAGIRPHHVQLRREGGGLRGRVVSVTSAGDAQGAAAGATLVEVRVEGVVVRALVPAEGPSGAAETWAPDDPVFVRIRPEHYIVFSDRGGHLNQVRLRSG